MQTDQFTYELPPSLIAQEPPARRIDARMLVYDRRTCAIRHGHISDIVEYLTPQDLLVMNNTRVIPARIFGRRRDTGGHVELLLLEPVQEPGQTAPCWKALFQTRGWLLDGVVIDFGGLLTATLVRRLPVGGGIFLLESKQSLDEVLEQIGHTPLPPYIKRNKKLSDTPEDRLRYQTVYAKEPGAVAAPTAGLHFTKELLQRIQGRGTATAMVTLHVGPGTFLPVKVKNLEDHVMHEERYSVGAECVQAVARARAQQGRVIAVGTTTVRTLESAAGDGRGVREGDGRTRIFIYPPYEFKVVDALLTNFHLPQSTLLMLVCAMGGREEMLRVYQEAVREQYRFFSYGDCMLIL